MDRLFTAADIRSTRFDELYYSPAVYFEGEIKAADGLRLIPSLRAEHFSRVDETIISPRFTATNLMISS